MKILRILIAAGLSSAAFSVLRADTNFGRQWMEQYYQNPRPQDLITAVSSLDRDGYFASAAQRDTAIGFFSQVFRQNPREVNGWLHTAARVLPEQARRILVAAAWFAGNTHAAPQLRELSAGDSADERAGIDRLLASGSQAQVAAVPVTSVPALNLQWGAFLASGSERYISNIFVALGSDQPGLTNAARYALARDAADNPRVLEICRTELARQPASVRAQFEAALNEAMSHKPSA